MGRIRYRRVGESSLLPGISFAPKVGTAGSREGGEPDCAYGTSAATFFAGDGSRSTSLTVRLSLTALSKVEWAALSLSKGGSAVGCVLAMAETTGPAGSA